MPTVTKRFPCEHCEDGFQDEILLAMHISERHNGNGMAIAKPIGQSHAVDLARQGVTGDRELNTVLFALMCDRLEGRLDSGQTRDACMIMNVVLRKQELNYRQAKFEWQQRKDKGEEDG